MVNPDPTYDLAKRKFKNGRSTGLSNKQKRLHPALHRRNKLQWLADLELARLRKIAAVEYNDFITSYLKRWDGILRRRNKGRRKRRSDLMRSTIVRADNSIRFQIAVIKAGPCKCFWCEAFLPKGATVDHIVSLAKGGRHTSDNVCAACPSCNSAKSDRHHNTVALSPALL